MKVESIKNIFRAYDIRGIVDKEVTNELALNIGKAYGSFLIKNGKKTIGVSGDVRLSTESLLDHLTKGLLSTGIDVVSFNKLPTPISYYSLHNDNLNVDAAIQITGSHNPSDYNGFKLTYDAKPFYGDDIQLLYSMILNEDYIISKGTFRSYDIISDYNQMIESKIKINKRLKVAIDCGNAAGCIIIPYLYEKFNIELHKLYCDIDGSFPNHHPDPTVDTNLVDLQNFVIKNKCDVGLAYDGDADRIVAIDENGAIIRSDILISIFLSKIINEKYNNIVPNSFIELESLPGVGHKTASVVMSQVFGVQTFPIDTHIHRLSQRWGLTSGKSVKQTEKDLKNLFPKHLWNKLHLQFIFYGREYCTARGCNGTVCKLCKELYPSRKKPVISIKA